MWTAEEIQQTILTVIVTALVAFGLFWGETYRRQSREFAAGEAAFKLNEAGFRQAITAYESALHMYTPWSSKIETASRRMREIGKFYEDKGDVDMALIAYRSLRSSFYATRSFYTPYPDVIAECDTKIAGLVELQKLRDAKAQSATPTPAPAPADATPSPEPTLGEATPASE